MHTIIRTPRRRLGWSLLHDFDRLFDEFTPRARSEVNESWHTAQPAVDVWETESAYLIDAELPGVGKDAIDVTIKDGVLTIDAGSEAAAASRADGRYLRRERRSGKFVRSLRLPEDVDGEKVKAEHVNGVLTLTLPKAAAAKPRRIDVAVH